MQYTNNYHIISINYSDTTRVTTVRIMCEDTGEIFDGIATRNPHDDMDIMVGANVALMRAIHTMVVANLKDDMSRFVEYGYLPLDYHC